MADKTIKYLPSSSRRMYKEHCRAYNIHYVKEQFVILLKTSHTGITGKLIVCNILALQMFSSTCVPLKVTQSLVSAPPCSQTMVHWSLCPSQLRLHRHSFAIILSKTLLPQSPLHYTSRAKPLLWLTQLPACSVCSVPEPSPGRSCRERTGLTDFPFDFWSLPSNGRLSSTSQSYYSLLQVPFSVLPGSTFYLLCPQTFHIPLWSPLLPFHWWSPHSCFYHFFNDVFEVQRF